MSYLGNWHRKRERNRVLALVVEWRSMFSSRRGKRPRRWYNTNGTVAYVDLDTRDR